MTMAIDDDVKVTINFNKLVEKRAKLLTQHGDFAAQVNKGEFLDENDIDEIALAVYSPIPFSFINSVYVLGNLPLHSSTINLAVFNKFLALE